VPTDEELKAWAAGEDIEGAKRGKGRSGFASSWFGTQALVIAGAGLFLAYAANPWWLLVLPMAALMAAKAVHASRKQATWNRLYGQDDHTDTRI
jgi:hypothetical protein